MTKKRAMAREKRKPTAAKVAAQTWSLLLYVAGQSPRSLTAVANLKKICDLNLAGRYHVEIVDLLANPRRCREDQIVALPTLVRKLPAPVRKIIGDLSDTARTLLLLQMSSS